MSAGCCRLCQDAPEKSELQVQRTDDRPQGTEEAMDFEGIAANVFI
jgi:hypothetical protein